MKLPTMFTQIDKLAHSGGGAYVASGATSAAIVALYFLRLPVVIAPLLGVAAAFGVNRAIEKRQAAQNAKAAAAGEPLPHEVTARDWQAGTWGGFAVALPVFILQIIALMR